MTKLNNKQWSKSRELIYIFILSPLFFFYSLNVRYHRKWTNAELNTLKLNLWREIWKFYLKKCSCTKFKRIECYLTQLNGGILKLHFGQCCSSWYASINISCQQWWQREQRYLAIINRTVCCFFKFLNIFSNH